MRTALCTTLVLLVLAGCSGYRPPRAVPAPGSEAEAAELLAESYVYFYPLRDQADARQSRDRYDCYLWAVRQTGFDPSMPGLAPHQRVRVVAVPPPEHGVVHGALAGAVVGAAIGHPDHTGGGAAIGAAVGALAGAARAGQVRAEVARQEAALRDRRLAELERVSQGYRRAMSACLEGRGYAVR